MARSRLHDLVPVLGWMLNAVLARVAAIKKSDPVPVKVGRYPLPARAAVTLPGGGQFPSCLAPLFPGPVEGDLHAQPLLSDLRSILVIGLGPVSADERPIGSLFGPDLLRGAKAKDQRFEADIDPLLVANDHFSILLGIGGPCRDLAKTFASHPDLDPAGAEHEVLALVPRVGDDLVLELADPVGNPSEKVVEDRPSEIVRASAGVAPLQSFRIWNRPLDYVVGALGLSVNDEDPRYSASRSISFAAIHPHQATILLEGLPL